MKNKIIIFLFINSIGLAFGQGMGGGGGGSGDNHDLKLSIGGGYVTSTNIRKHNNLPAMGGDKVDRWIPMIMLSWGPLALRGPGLALSVLREPLASITLMAGMFGHQYRSPDLNRRHSTLAGGVEARLLLLRINYQHDLEGRSDGSTCSFNLGYRIGIIEEDSSWKMGLMLGVFSERFDQKYVDYYFGVRAHEVRMDLERPAYNGPATWNQGFSLSLNNRFFSLINLTPSFRYRYYGSGIKNSPTVRTNIEKSYSIMLSFELF